VSIPTGVVVVLGAVIVTVLAVLAPARAAAAVAPLQALRSASIAAGERGLGAYRLIGGLVLAAGAALAAGLVYLQVPEPGAAGSYDTETQLLTIVASGALAFCALIALGPLLVRPVLAAARRPLSLLGPVGRLAVGGVGGAPRRAAAVSVVVALGVTLLSGTIVGAASLQAHVDRGSALRAPADFVVVRGGGKSLPATIVDGFRADTKLKDVTAFRMAEASIGGETATSVDLDLRSVPALADVDPADGSLADIGPGAAALSATLAADHGFGVGDTVRLNGKNTQVDLRVVAVFPAAGPIGADQVTHPADLDRLGVPAGASAILANAAAAGEQNRAAAGAVIKSAIAGIDDAEVGVPGDERDDTKEDIAFLTILALGLIGLTVIIAVVGVSSTMALSVVERLREAGLLRALGMTRQRLRAMLTTEAGLYGMVGAILGLALGVPYAWLSIVAMNLVAPLRLPVVQLGVLALGLLAVTALAGVLPARRAVRVSPVEALGSDE
jgi:putative ABC transport system permease protein